MTTIDHKRFFEVLFERAKDDDLRVMVLFENNSQSKICKSAKEAFDYIKEARWYNVYVHGSFGTVPRDFFCIVKDRIETTSDKRDGILGFCNEIIKSL